MPVTLLMYDRGLEPIRNRLDALGLDLDIATFDRDCHITRQGRPVTPETAALDYVWLSAPITGDGIQEQAFALVERLKSVRVLQTYNAGLDHPFYKRMAARGTQLCNSSAQGIAISEYVLGQVLSVMQPIERQRALQAERRWQITPFRELSQTSWLVIGFGPIGREITKRVKAFGAKVTVARRTADTGGIADAAGTFADIPRLLPTADIVVLACPLNAETRGFADARFFAAMKEGAVLVNVARGALIDDGAMLAALDGPRLATAILDVFAEEPLPATSPFWAHQKVRLTGHTSFAGSGVRSRWEMLFLDNIGRFVRGEALANVVDPGSLA
ncbi:MAG: NAD(P)-dependent oxidoreductase [Hyphomicrobiaceae bacterium]|nr:NAD(P)-dependent oxidoreductase [Hyphomicrobiaceae bacterium]